MRYAVFSRLGHFGRTQACLRLDEKLPLVLCNRNEIRPVFARTKEDDENEASDGGKMFFYFADTQTSLSSEGVAILIATLNKECEKLLSSSSEKPSIRPLEQAVKAVCFSLAQLETPQLHVDLQRLAKDVGSGTSISRVARTVENIKSSVQHLVHMYERAFHLRLGLKTSMYHTTMLIIYIYIYISVHACNGTI